ncbi:NAD(P)H-quinone oxidoreductase [Oleispirillum naphthae]|uniref:NAD(P)H-quinone oxidoreductase n=1 Tax=Oleispirillum naphthae TaxID=2838853 RepID=UPI0030825C6B
MKAVLVNENKDLVWSDVPDPEVGSGEALVKIHAAALNRADLLQREGKYPSPPGCPEWMGLEVAGKIVRLGEDTQDSGWKVGDAVCALLGGGGYAEYVSVKTDMLMPVPKGLTLEEASALPEAFATSYLNLFIEGGLSAGQTAFIPAGASGLASAAIPLAKAFGARVITSVLSDEIAAQIAHLKADVVINSAKQDVEAVFIAEKEAGHPVNVAMDCLGGKMLGKCLPHMARDGRWILISTLAGEVTEVGLRPLLTGGVRLIGSMLRNRPIEMKVRILKELVENVWPKMERGEIKPSVYKILPIAQAEEAHAILQRGESKGKVVLRIL